MEVVLPAFMQVLFEKLATAALNELRLPLGVGGELQNLSTTLSTIQALLEDAEEKQLKDRSVRSWLAKLKEVAWEMDELLDECAAESLRLKVEFRAQSRWRMQVSKFFYRLSWHRGLFSYEIANRIKATRERFDRLARERDILGLQILTGTSRLEITERPQTSSLVDDSSVFGREEDREKIVKDLLSANSNPGRLSLSVLPIVGMGGLGKTTLTQLVYNDPRVKEHFPLRMWVSVADNFDEMKLTRQTLEYAGSGYSFATTNMNLLQEDLFNKLEGKRFLLVLDDVWNEDPHRWYRYCTPLIGGELRSKIIVTTQNENVGRIMGGLLPYHLKQLSDNDCWKLFRIYAFAGCDSSAHPSLEEIGKEIVKKVKGLPLAAKALGSLLASRLDEEYWVGILKSEIWELPPGKNNILPALRLSYKHLPPHLKQCFAFCSVFHKDYVFDKDRLVQIWIALGFVQPQGRKRLEDIGSSYFDDLLSRSFFQSHKGKNVMHDAIHDLAQSISIDECLTLENNVRNDAPVTIQHLSFSCDNSRSTSLEVFDRFDRLRTLLLLRGYKSITSPIPQHLFFKLRYLRVLDLCRRDINEVPNSIGNLKQLRYLSLSRTAITNLPSSISRLYNLQTLKLLNCDLLDEIPKGVTKLVNLRHLEASSRLIIEIAGIGNLTCLQELEEFVVSNNRGHQITELKDMSELRGHLCIRNLEEVVSGEEASNALLNIKENLSTIELVWSDDRNVSVKDESLDEKVLESLQPHAKLKELNIKGFAGANFPGWLGSPVFYLQTIHLSNCRRCRLLPPLGQLPLLRYLDIGAMFGVIRIGQEFSGRASSKMFPSLKEFVLEDMPDLEEWICSEDGEVFPCLTDLEVVDCPKLRELPCLPPTVTRLRISEVGVNLLPEVRGSYSPPSLLSSLHIHECPNLTSLQQGLLSQQLRNLKELTITDCEELVSLPMEGFHSLVSLKSLHIYNCPKLEPWAQEGSLLPRTLEDLRISSCSKLINQLLAQLKTLPTLVNLTITDCPDLYCFPEELLPVTLNSLGMSDFKNLRYLPSRLQELSCLTTLTISSCPKIQHLPEEGLPTVLQELYIRECPLLKENCQENGGQDWSKISHIPCIEIDLQRIIPERR